MSYLLYSVGESDLSVKIAKKLNISLSTLERKVFPSGELLLKPVDSVRGKQVFIIYANPFPVNEQLMSVLIFIDALRRASAEEINVFMPYFPYARQDRKSKPREPISAQLVANLLVSAGAKRIITVDLHSPQLQGFFSCLEDDLTAIPLISQTLLEELGNTNIAVVSPDHGGVTRARRVAKVLSSPLVIIDKRRDDEYKPAVMHIIGEAKGKDCIIVDDMIDTGGSAVSVAHALKDAGARKIYMAVTHPVFSDPAFDILSKDNCFDKMYVTDSIPLDERFKKSKINIEVLSLSDLIASAILSIYNKTPVSEIYN